MSALDEALWLRTLRDLSEMEVEIEVNEAPLERLKKKAAAALEAHSAANYSQYQRRERLAATELILARIVERDNIDPEVITRAREAARAARALPPTPDRK